MTCSDLVSTPRCDSTGGDDPADPRPAGSPPAFIGRGVRERFRLRRRSLGRVAAAFRREPGAGTYRPDIDGLRAIAVAAVIINHLDRHLLPGGYLGVDVFFVISGFVITGSLRHRPVMHLGQFLSDFFARRCRRLVPALAVCVAASGVAAWVVDPHPAASLNTGLAALVGMANMSLLYTSQDYFAPATALNLFTQTWSLGVEEQFYLVFPLLAWCTGLSRVNRGAWRLFLACLGLSLLSLVALALLPGKAGGAAYFLMFSRFWELGAGCMAAIARSARPGPGRARHRFVWLSLGCMLLTMVLPIQPGVLMALAVVPPTVALLLAGEGTMLASRPVLGVGRMSYSLYLWHWPVVSTGLLAFGDKGWTVAAQVLAIPLLGAASFQLVERPARARLGTHPNGWSFVAVVIAAAAAAGLLAALEHWPNPAPLVERRFVKVPADFPLFPETHVDHLSECVVDGFLRPARLTTFDRCTLPPGPGVANTVWAMGDSHAGHLRGLLVALHEQAGLGIHLIETPGIAFPVPSGTHFAARDIFFATTLVKMRPGDIVLLGRLFVSREGAFQPLPDVDAWISAVEALADRLRPLGVHVAMAGPPPAFRFASIYGCAPGRERGTECDIDRATLAAAIDPIEAALKNAANRHTNLHVFSEFAALCPEATRTCSPVRAGIPLFRDRDHLNSLGSESMAPAFFDFLAEQGLACAPGRGRDCQRRAGEPGKTPAR